MIKSNLLLLFRRLKRKKGDSFIHLLGLGARAPGSQNGIEI